MIAAHCDFSLFFIFRQKYPYLLPVGAGIVFTHGPLFRFFTPQGRHIAPINVKFGREDWTVRDMDIGE